MCYLLWDSHTVSQCTRKNHFIYAQKKKKPVVPAPIFTKLVIVQTALGAEMRNFAQSNQ
jgi:hypothetical protein